MDYRTTNDIDDEMMLEEVKEMCKCQHCGNEVCQAKPFGDLDDEQYYLRYEPSDDESLYWDKELSEDARTKVFKAERVWYTDKVDVDRVKKDNKLLLDYEEVEEGDCY